MHIEVNHGEVCLGLAPLRLELLLGLVPISSMAFSPPIALGTPVSLLPINVLDFGLSCFGWRCPRHTTPLLAFMSLPTAWAASLPLRVGVAIVLRLVASWLVGFVRVLIQSALYQLVDVGFRVKGLATSLDLVDTSI